MGQPSQVAAKGLQNFVGWLGAVKAGTLIPAHLGQRLIHPFLGHVVLGKDPRGGAADAQIDQGKKEVLQADKIIVEAGGFALGKIEGAGQAGRRVACVAKRLWQHFELDQELGADDHLIDPEAQDQVGDGPFLELHEREHGVLGLDLTVMLFGCDLLGREEGLLGLLAELALCHVVPQYNLSAKL